MKRLLKKIEGLPIGAVGATVGACTLSTVYHLLGFNFIRHAVLCVAIFVWFAMLAKIVLHFSVFKSEYNQAVSGSLYGLFAMLTMIIGSYLSHYIAPLGKTLWLLGILLHLVHIICFTAIHLIKNFKFELLVPTWFVSYMGILVS
ncbi:MAG TPA: transporter, partial [Firmicutes bacterium]|nr:transporter [Bacillota bacterium]